MVNNVFSATLYLPLIFYLICIQGADKWHWLY